MRRRRTSRQIARTAGAHGPALGDAAVKRLVETRAIAADSAAIALLKAWWEAAGPTLARAARPAGVAGGRLELLVDDGRWQRQIEEVHEILLARLRRRKGLEDLCGIRVVVDPRATLAREPDGVPTAVLPAPEEILRAAQSIEDDDLKRRWCGAIARHLMRRAAKLRR